MRPSPPHRRLSQRHRWKRNPPRRSFKNLHFLFGAGSGRAAGPLCAVELHSRPPCTRLAPSPGPKRPEWPRAGPLRPSSSVPGLEFEYNGRPGTRAGRARTPRAFWNLAQGWRARAYPGSPSTHIINPNGVVASSAPTANRNPVGVECRPDTTPRVACGNPGLGDRTPLAFFTARGNPGFRLWPQTSLQPISRPVSAKEGSPPIRRWESALSGVGSRPGRQSFREHRPFLCRPGRDSFRRRTAVPALKRWAIFFRPGGLGAAFTEPGPFLQSLRSARRRSYAWGVGSAEF